LAFFTTKSMLKTRTYLDPNSNCMQKRERRAGLRRRLVLFEVFLEGFADFLWSFQHVHVFHLFQFFDLFYFFFSDA
jgi:hypothetical protein